MKLTKKNTPQLIVILIFCILAGSFAWFIIELIFSGFGLPFSLSTGKIGFDLKIISFYIDANPGTVLGIAGGFFVFKAV